MGFIPRLELHPSVNCGKEILNMPEFLYMIIIGISCKIFVAKVYHIYTFVKICIVCICNKYTQISCSLAEKPTSNFYVTCDFSLLQAIIDRIFRASLKSALKIHCAHPQPITALDLTNYTPPHFQKKKKSAGA